MPQAVSLLLQPGLPAIVRNYLLQKSELLDFAGQFPANADFSSLSRTRSFSPESRNTLVEAIRSQYGTHPKAEIRESLEKLSRQDTRTVVTGHQLCLAGGPLYLAVKIAQTIALARKLESAFKDISVVPVFWMASEDHDKEEIDHIEIFGKKFTWPAQASGAVGRFSTDGMRDVLSEALQALSREAGYAEVLSLVEGYCEKPTLAEATRYLVDSLFGKYGLLVVDGDDPSLKRLFADVMESELKDKISAPALEKSSERLRALGYHTQINPREINLFLLGDQQRSRIIATASGFGLADSAWETDTEALLEEVRKHPEKFSPNVVLRPLYQESILPNLAVVLGPGELSYWLQLKEVFTQFGCAFPILVPRDSFYVLDASLLERIARLGMEASEFLESEAQLTRKWLGKLKPVSFQDIRAGWQKLIDEAAGRAASVDESLRNAFLAEGSRQLAAWDSLEKKVDKAIKSREADSLNRIKAIQEKLLPGGVPSERKEALLRYLAQHRMAFADHLVGIAGSDTQPSIWFWCP